MILLPLSLAIAFVIAVLALPVVGMLTDPANWKPSAPPSPEPQRAAFPVGKGFKPLDLGPDLTRWPSETPWTHSPAPEPPWPSHTWNDPHFGLSARKKAPVPAAPTPLEPIFTVPEPEVVVEKVKAVVSAAKNRRAPTPDEVDQMLENIGLSATITQIRTQTGWEFKDVVAFLQKQRRS